MCGGTCCQSCYSVGASSVQVCDRSVAHGACIIISSITTAVRQYFVSVMWHHGVRRRCSIVSVLCIFVWPRCVRYCASIVPVLCRHWCQCCGSIVPALWRDRGPWCRLAVPALCSVLLYVLRQCRVRTHAVLTHDLIQHWALHGWPIIDAVPGRV